MIFVTFIATTWLIKGRQAGAWTAQDATPRGGWAALPDKRPVIAMLATGMLLMLANMSIEPIITCLCRAAGARHQPGDDGGRPCR